jgi:DNA adenine methylase
MSEQATPVIKWVGGKTRLLPALLARVPAQFGRYFEPFAGGAALFFRIAPDRAVLGDANADLIGLYDVLGRHADDVEAVIYRLRQLAAHHSREYYLEMRTRWNDAGVSWTSLDRAATFVYLNKTCFNGLWRVNRAGHFNVPPGDAATFETDADNLRAAGVALRRAVLRRGSYRDTVADAKAGDFVYFDPPYDPVTKTANFTGYTSGAFGEAQQRELAEVARDLLSRGCKVMLSNSDTPLIRELYRGFRIDRVHRSGSVNSDPTKRGKVAELVISSGHP